MRGVTPPHKGPLYKRKLSHNNLNLADIEREEQAAPIMEMHNRTANGGREPHGPHGPHDNILGFTFPLNKKQKEKEEKPEDYSKDWKRMAEVFDRLFFWLFLLAILISTLVLFHPLTNQYFPGSNPQTTVNGK